MLTYFILLNSFFYSSIDVFLHLFVTDVKNEFLLRVAKVPISLIQFDTIIAAKERIEIKMLIFLLSDSD